MAIERLDHVAMLTSNVERSARFFCEWAGMKVVHDRRDPGHTHRVVWVKLPAETASLIIVMIESEQQRPQGWMDHFGFHVTSRDEVNSIAERARAIGILVDEPQYAGPVVGYFCTIKDPDGNLLEFSCEQLKI